MAENQAIRTKKHLVLRLRKGWSYDPQRRRFQKEGQPDLVPGEDLPKYTRILPQVPSLLKKQRRSAAEDELARGVQIVPPSGAALEKIAAKVEAWNCTQKVWVAPEIQPAPGKKPAAARRKQGRAPSVGSRR